MMEYDSFEERLKYLQLYGESYPSPREISNPFYKSPAWEAVRKEVIFRDGYWDLGVHGVNILTDILVHHINPLEPKDFEEFNEDKLINPDNLVTVSVSTHNMIHYKIPVVDPLVERSSGDTKLW